MDGLLNNAWWITGIVLYTQLKMSLLPAVIISFGVAAVGNMLATSLAESRKKRLGRSDPGRAEYDRLIADFADFAENKSLAERLHPAIGALLEDCAAHLEAIRRDIRLQSEERRKSLAPVLDSAEGAMRRAVLLAAGGYRPRGLQKKTWRAEIERNPEGHPEAVDLAEIRDGLAEIRSALGTKGEGDQLRAALAHLADLKAAEDELDEAIDGVVEARKA